ncbi:larval cuticle protein LCP-17 [Cephus cinctus]|uniref:Larval cuticle protein LCP-17 n=1 Tax=Cephus cinctus TaxID=211228 RepID=A0AAJ7BW98_CEPCN|nr:larval cuticle protein LCP-17 [Cephus cinctus]
MKAFFVISCVLVATVMADISEKVIPILSQEQDISPDGSFSTKWVSGNGISVQEQGALKNPGTKDEAQVIKGAASWTDPNGVPVQLSWNADENGAVFQGSHIPVAPEIPVLIQRALAWNAAHPSKEDN